MSIVVDSKHPHISLFTSIRPSGDWILTGDSINLCNTDTGMWLSELNLQTAIVDMARTAGTNFAGTAPVATGEKIAEVGADASGAALPPLARVVVKQRRQPVCTASGSRTYKLQFKGTALSGRVYPPNFAFGEIFGMAHGPDADLFDVGGTINNGIQAIVESDDSDDADGVLQVRSMLSLV